MKHPKYIILTLLVLLWFEAGHAQRSYPYFTKRINKYNSSFNQNIVSDLILDNHNILWIATPTSLFQYNGSEIKLIETPNKNRPVNFFRNFDNKILLLYSDGNTYELNKNNITFYFKDTTQNDFIVNYQFLCVSRKYLENVFYKLGYRSFYYNTKITQINNDEIIHTSHKKDEKSINLFNFKTGKNRILIQHKESEVSEYITTPNAWFTVFKNGRISEIYNPLKYRIDPIPIPIKNRKTYKLINKPNEIPILVSENRIWILKEENKHYFWEEIKNDLPEDISIQSGRYSEKLEKLFLATESDGLIILTKNKFTTYYDNQKIHKSNYYLQIIYNHEIFTNGGSVNTQSIHNLFFRNHILNNNYLFLDQHNIIISDDQCIMKYNFQNATKKIIYKTQFNGYTNFIKKDSNILLIGKYFILNYSLRTDKIDTIKLDQFGKLNTDVVRIINKKIWIGSGSGLTVFDLEKKCIVKRLITQITIRNIAKIQDNYYLCSYGEGILKIDSATYDIQKLPMDFSRSIQYSHGIIEDKLGNLWISTNTGLLRFTKNSFTQSIKLKKYIPEPEYFDTEDGLLTDEFNGGASPAFITNGDTFISLPTIKGIVQFNPLKINSIDNQYELKINKIHYLNKPLPLEKNHYFLSNNIEEVTIDFDVVYWGNIRNLNLYYRVNNIDKKIEFKDIHQLKIPINFYKNAQLEIFTYNRLGKKIILKKINLFKELPWFLQVPYLLLAFALIYLFSFVISKFRTNRINKRNQELENLIKEKTNEIQKINLQLLSQVNQLSELNNANTTYISVINHDIFAPIKYINIIGDKISQNFNQIKKADILLQFNHIIGTTKRLELLCSNILNYIHSNQNFESSKIEINLHQLIEELRVFLSIGLEINQNKMVNAIPINIKIVSNQDALNIILTNLLSNANRFTKKGEIKIEIVEAENNTIISISDTGKGMNQFTLEKIREKSITVSHRNNLEYQSYGIGYSLIYKMLNLIQADFEINSKVDSGTCVKITIPKQS